MATTTRIILSLLLSMLLFALPVFSWSLWKHGIAQTQNRGLGQTKPDGIFQPKTNAVGQSKPEIKRSHVTTEKRNIISWSQPLPLSYVEFKLIPYARVFDITNHSRPKFLLDSHYATVRMRKGGHRLLFEYSNKRYELFINVDGHEKYTLFFDLNRGQYDFYRKN